MGCVGDAKSGRSKTTLEVLLQLLAASQADRSAGHWKSSRASANDSSCSSGRAWIWTVVASLKGDAGYHHDFCLGELGKTLHQHRQHNRV